MSPRAFFISAAVGAVLLLALAYGQTVDTHDKIMGCYLGTWAFYRPDIGSFDIDDFDPTLCTHGFYGFADMDNQTWEIKVWDPWYDLDPVLDAGTDECPEGYCNYNSYRRFVALKEQNPNFVPMISIGGWTSGSARFSDMAKDPAKRSTFIASVIEFVARYGFEGVDFDWEYPSFREGSDPEVDRDNFSILVEELGAALHAENLVFSAAVNAGFDKVQYAYDVPRILAVFDFVNLMTYDYHGYWNDGRINHTEFTGHNSPLITRTEENQEDHPGYKYSIYDGVFEWLNLGADPAKLVVGIATYGRGFTLENELLIGSYCPAIGPLPAGPYTRLAATWGYQEIIMGQQNLTVADNLPGAEPLQWTVVTDSCYLSPYMYNGPYWIGYDDPDSGYIKGMFANSLGLAGAFVWSIDTDEFIGNFADESFPVIKSINRALASGDEFFITHECVSTYPNCDYELPDSTLPDTCTENGEYLPHPSSCHWYYRCVEEDDGSFSVVHYDCGDDYWDPVAQSCIYNPELCPPDENGPDRP